MMLKTISIRVWGKVQGVYYRQGTREKARELLVTGEVMNQPDGSVGITATGEMSQLDQLIEWCKQGPPRAKVAEVIVEETELRVFEGFVIRR